MTDELVKLLKILNRMEKRDNSEETKKLISEAQAAVKDWIKELCK